MTKKPGIVRSPRGFLFLCLAGMSALLMVGVLSPQTLLRIANHPEFYLHAKFIHILSVTLFFASAVIGAIWETRSLLSKNAEMIRYTYQTIVWFDALFSAPLILLSVMSGLILSTSMGGVWSAGWLSIAFLLFLGSGLVWVIADIPTQYRVNTLFKSIAPGQTELPAELTRLLWKRAVISFVGTAPLLAIFFLMVHKPDLPMVTALFSR